MFNPFSFYPLHATLGVREFVGGVILYIYLGYTLMILAQRLHVRRSWLAWIPIGNLYLLTQMARREWWLLFGFFIPIVNIFMLGFLWSEVAEHLGKSPWVGVAIVIPLLGLLVPGYLVISTGNRSAHHHA